MSSKLNASYKSSSVFISFIRVRFVKYVRCNSHPCSSWAKYDIEQSAELAPYNKESIIWSREIKPCFLTASSVYDEFSPVSSLNTPCQRVRRQGQSAVPTIHSVWPPPLFLKARNHPLNLFGPVLVRSECNRGVIEIQRSGPSSQKVYLHETCGFTGMWEEGK